MESRRMRSRSQILKWVCYVLGLFVCAALQTTPGLFQLGQAKPLFILPLCLAVAVYEGEFAGALFGAVGGLLWDYTAGRTVGMLGLELLLLGFGPVGQALGVRLAALGTNVTVCARRPEQRALAQSLGLRAAPLQSLAALAPAFDTVVNTIPAAVLTAPVLERLRPGSLIVDLASKPGGTDFAAAQRLGHRAIHALSLPAACAPDTAGEAVARTVQAILQEREEHA